MNYQQALDYIYTSPKYGSKELGTERVIAFLRELGHPQKAMKYVHIAGTNGKGSATAMTGSVLMAAGYKTGMFISPFLERFNERVQLDGVPIPDDKLIAFTQSVGAVAEAMPDKGFGHPSWFELLLGIAFQYWRDSGCDFVALEVGLGGAQDATNVIDPPDVAIIASISFDHMRILGDTIREIAAEKCGIIKPGSSVVCYADQHPEALEVIRETCKQRGAELIIPDKNAVRVLSDGIHGSEISYQGIETTVPLMGYHQVLNALGVIEAARALRGRGYDITDEHISRGISETKWVGRLEIIDRSPTCIIDAAHNNDAVRVLTEAVDSYLSGRELTVVMGMLADKDYRWCIPEVAKRAKTFIAATPEGVRALPAAETAEVAKPHCSRVELSDSLHDAIERAYSVAGEDGTILICGSIHLIGEAKTYVLSR